MAAAYMARISLLAQATRRAAQAPPPRPFMAAAMRRTLGSLNIAHKEKEVPRSVPARVAYELQQAGHRYLDVRTEDEFSAGHPEGAVNVPYMYRSGSGMMKNTHFLEQMSGVFRKDDEIIVGCQSGKRSLMAGTELYAAGFTAVTDIAGGFSSWRENGLPVNLATIPEA
ncbi:hypothetical protein PR202_gb28499 [Eleusine coracana subsp. coracana]|uniref:Rhodanese domain-containing protein n=1 Tax=Eleusine coracana subsp. coracana TaxID=191504 RepID=A0AAV5FY09_ELECO|nr:hypothetical protein QOZ80_6AG0551210 [Eleusine coracana subsp. coracana]GJN39385.1 hypothetical protein PR202_gb28499 [Eleusine coracana subsp. coracana]